MGNLDKLDRISKIIDIFELVSNGIAVFTDNGIVCTAAIVTSFLLLLIQIYLYRLDVNRINNTRECKHIGGRENKEEYKENIEKSDRKYRWRIALLVIVFVLLIFFKGQTALAFVWGVFSGDEPKTGNDTESDAETEKVIIEGMTFYLDDPNAEAHLLSEDISKALFKHYYEDDINEDVKDYMQLLIDENRKDTFSNNLTSTEKDEINQASAKEAVFDKSCIEAKKYAAEGDYENWKSSLMHSAELDAIIESRISVWNDGKRDGEIAALIANDYQCYALEYQNQNKSGDIILFYYVQSINWSINAIVYEDANEREQFEYIKTRYLDIASCQAIPENYRMDALGIYNAMGEYEDYIK